MMKLFTALVFSILLCACSSSPKLPVAQEESLDYTQKDVHDAEVKRVYEMLQNNPVEALWRATILGDKAISDECAGYARDALASHIEQKDYVEAWTFYNSLGAAGYGDLAEKAQ